MAVENKRNRVKKKHGDEKGKTARGERMKYNGRQIEL